MKRAPSLAHSGYIPANRSRCSLQLSFAFLRYSGMLEAEPFSGNSQNNTIEDLHVSTSQPEDPQQQFVWKLVDARQACVHVSVDTVQFEC